MTTPAPRTPVTFCTAKKSPKSRQGGFAPSGLPHSSWAGGARKCAVRQDGALPPNFCALPWQDWQNVKLRLPALHVELPAGLRSRCAMRTDEDGRYSEERTSNEKNLKERTPMESIIKLLAQELDQTEDHVKNVITLLDEGNTIPFIARYRRTAQQMRHAHMTRSAVSPAPCRWPGSLFIESCFSEANPTMGTVGPGSCGGDSRRRWHLFGRKK